jgi:hypothetical protein
MRGLNIGSIALAAVESGLLVAKIQPVPSFGQVNCVFANGGGVASVDAILTTSQAMQSNVSRPSYSSRNIRKPFWRGHQPVVSLSR